jgi:hypothetical protein
LAICLSRSRGGRLCGEFRQLIFRFVDKGSSGAEIEGAFLALKEVLFECFSLLRRELVQEVTLRGHHFYCFSVIHFDFPG